MKRKAGDALKENVSPSSTRLTLPDVRLLLLAHVNLAIESFVQHDGTTVNVSLEVLSDAKMTEKWSASNKNLNTQHCSQFGCLMDKMTGKKKPSFWRSYENDKVCWLILVDGIMVGMCACQSTTSVDNDFIPSGYGAAQRGKMVRNNLIDLVWIKSANMSDQANLKGVMTHAIRHLCSEIMKIDSFEGIIAVIREDRDVNGGLKHDRSIALAVAAGLQRVDSSFHAKYLGPSRSFVLLRENL